MLVPYANYYDDNTMSDPNDGNAGNGFHDSYHVPPFFVYGVASGFVGFFVVFHFMRVVLIPRFATPSFRKQIASFKTRKETTFFYATFPSMIHALVQCLSIRCLYSAAHNSNHVTHFDDGWPACFSGIFVGYLTADIFACGPADLGPGYMFHHVTAIVTWAWVACLGAMQWYASLLQFCEFSTIFMNIRQWVLTAGYSSSSPIAMVVSILFFLSFLAVRVIPLPTLVYQWVTNDFFKLYDEKGKAVAMASSSAMLVHVVLQSFWFMLMVKKIAKLVLSSGDRKKSKREE